MRVTAWLAVLLLALTLTGCSGSSPSARPTTMPTSAPTAEPTAEPTEPATTEPAITERPTTEPAATFAPGSPAADCRDGWSRPEPGSEEYEHALEVLSAQMGVVGPWTVDDMRYFTGPEVPFSEPAYEPVERWYVKASLVDDPSFRARWILERRTEMIQGISAIARYETTGYEASDWTAFIGEGPPVSYEGLPGQWAGIPYDFVTGGGDSGNPGLPDEVVGCLAGI